MNLGEMKKFVRIMMGDNDLTPYHSDDDIVLFLNEGMVAVCTEAQSLLTWSDASTVQGDDRYPLPPDFLQLKDVQIIDNDIRYPLEPLGYDSFERMYGLSGLAQRRPQAYRPEYGATDIAAGAAPGDLTLGPIPDAGPYTLRVVYYQRATLLKSDGTDDGNSYELQVYFHKPVCYHACMNLSARYDDTSRMTKFAALYSQSMKAAQDMVGRLNRTGGGKFEKAYGCGKSQWRRKR